MKLQWIEFDKKKSLYAETGTFSRYWIHKNGKEWLLELKTPSTNGSHWHLFGRPYETKAKAKRAAQDMEKEE